MAKPIELFYKSKRSRDGLHHTCIECNRARQLKNLYDITPNDYDKMLEAQNGLCAICVRPEILVRRGKIVPLFVDHCHETGKIRGLLCYTCNSAIGFLRDNSEICGNAAAYLRAGGFIK
jgi:hypothetical protein